MILDHSYFLVFPFILFLSFLLFFKDNRYFNLSFFPGTIVCFIGIYISQEMSIVKEGESFKDDLAVVGLGFSIVAFTIQKVIVSIHIVENKLVEHLINIGVQASSFMHEKNER